MTLKDDLCWKIWSLLFTEVTHNFFTHLLVNSHFGYSNKMYISMQGNAFLFVVWGYFDIEITAF